MFVRLAWLDVAGQWPGVLPQPLATGTFTATIPFEGETHVRFSATDQPPGWGFQSAPARIREQLCSLDVDDNGQVTALTDGLLIIRYLFGFTGAALVDGAIGPGAQRSNPNDIAAYLAGCETTMLDVDGNGQWTALTDGLMIVRHLFGFACPAVSDGAVGIGCTRCSCQEIVNYIDGFNPLPIAEALNMSLPTMTSEASRGFQSLASRLDRSRLAREGRVSVDVRYAADMALTGMGLRMHFDSSKLRLEDLERVLEAGKIQHAVMEDTLDFDGDPATDRYLAIAWADAMGNWPESGPSQLLFTAVFRVSAGATGSTSINYTALDTPPGFALDAKSVKLGLGRANRKR
jgi:hypothetical protein